MSVQYSRGWPFQWIACMTVTGRVVLRAYVAASSGGRSVKMRRVQVGWRQINFRTISRIQTASAPQWRSLR